VRYNFSFLQIKAKRRRHQKFKAEKGKFVSMPKMLLTGMTCEKRQNLWGDQMDTYVGKQG